MRSVRNRVLYLIVVSLPLVAAPVWPCTVQTTASRSETTGGYQPGYTTTYRVHYWHSDYGSSKSKPPSLEEMMRADRRDRCRRRSLKVAARRQSRNNDAAASLSTNCS